MDEQGYIIMPRNIRETPVFASMQLFKIFFWCVTKATYKETNVPLQVGRGSIVVNLKRSQFIFGRFKAEQELFIDGSAIYRSMQKLSELGFITIETNNQYSIVSICNYDDYQHTQKESEQPTNNQRTTNEQPTNNQRTTNEQPTNTKKASNTSKKSNTSKQLNTTIGEFQENSPSSKSYDDLVNEFKKKVWTIVNEKRPDLKNKLDELKKFTDYWTEKGESQKKMRYQHEKVFDVAKRLDTWIERAEKNQDKYISHKTNTVFTGKKDAQRFSDINEFHAFTGFIPFQLAQKRLFDSGVFSEDQYKAKVLEGKAFYEKFLGKNIEFSF